MSRTISGVFSATFDDLTVTNLSVFNKTSTFNEDVNVLEDVTIGGDLTVEGGLNGVLGKKTTATYTAPIVWTGSPRVLYPTNIAISAIPTSNNNYWSYRNGTADYIAAMSVLYPGSMTGWFNITVEWSRTIPSGLFYAFVETTATHGDKVYLVNGSSASSGRSTVNVFMDTTKQLQSYMTSFESASDPGTVSVSYIIVNGESPIAILGDTIIGYSSDGGGLKVFGQTKLRDDVDITGDIDIEGNMIVETIDATDLRIGSARSIEDQGAWVQWNRDNGSGRTYLINQQGGGSGGIEFGKSNTSNSFTKWAEFDSNGEFVSQQSLVPKGGVRVEGGGVDMYLATSVRFPRMSLGIKKIQMAACWVDVNFSTGSVFPYLPSEVGDGEFGSGGGVYTNSTSSGFQIDWKNLQVPMSNADWGCMVSVTNDDHASANIQRNSMTTDKVTILVSTISTGVFSGERAFRIFVMGYDFYP